MVRTSFQASQQGVQQAEDALRGLRLTRNQLQAQLKCSRQPISKFFNQKPVACDLFVDICNKLGLDWQEIREDEQNKQDIDTLVREIRSKTQGEIIKRCGTMRVLDMRQPISLNDIYTDVYILEKITGKRRLELEELKESYDPNSDDFERHGLNKREKRVSGHEIVNNCAKVVVLGKPGSGKTTFLKYLSLQCIKGEFQSKRVPIFITLKEFAEKSGKPDLLTFIQQTFNKLSVREDEIIEILKQGRCLIFLDGLDEVKEEDIKRVLDDVESFSRTFSLSLQFQEDVKSHLKTRGKIEQAIKRLITKKEISEKTLRLLERKLKKFEHLSTQKERIMATFQKTNDSLDEIKKEIKNKEESGKIYKIYSSIIEQEKSTKTDFFSKKDIFKNKNSILKNKNGKIQNSLHSLEAYFKNSNQLLENSEDDEQEIEGFEQPLDDNEDDEQEIEGFEQLLDDSEDDKQKSSKNINIEVDQEVKQRIEDGKQEIESNAKTLKKLEQKLKELENKINQFFFHPKYIELKKNIEQQKKDYKNLIKEIKHKHKTIDSDKQVLTFTCLLLIQSGLYPFMLLFLQDYPELTKRYPNISDYEEYPDQGLRFLSEKFPDKIYQNHFVITCRIASQQFNFQQFTEVEIADFDDRQIQVFTHKWFHQKDPVKEKNFLQKLAETPSIRDLATSPLLLTLLCLVFEEGADFPKNRADLYKEGVSILLQKWDAERNIYREQIYKNLTNNRKQDLLSQIALTTFERNDYFFKQQEVEENIAT